LDALGGDLAFVPERFEAWAMLCAPLWFAIMRCWAALGLWIVAYAAILGGAHLAGLRPGPTVALAAIGAILCGLEAGSIRRKALEHRGYRMVEVVSGAAIEDAERAYFLRRGGDAAPAPARPAAAARLSPPSDVGGLFSDAGG